MRPALPRAGTVSPAETIYRGGSILTMESSAPRAAALAVAGGRILAVGDDATVMAHANSATRHADLQGATLMPAFVDPHSHLVFTARKLACAGMESPPIAGIRSIADIQTTLRESLAAENDWPPERWLIGWGYDHAGLAEGRHPNRHDLDTVTTTQPVFLYHYSAHQAVVNTRALEMLGIDADTPDPEGGVIVREADNRTPNGLLEETAMVAANSLAMRSLQGWHDAKSLILQAVDHYASRGYATAVECGARPSDLGLLGELADAGSLKLDVIAFPFFAFMPPEEVASVWSREYRGRFRVGGQKLMLDGGSPGRTAYLREPYHRQLPGEQNYRGYARIGQHEVNDIVARCFKNGVPLIIHALGDAALDQAIAGLNVGQYVAPGDDRRTQLIHLQQVQEDQFDRLRDLDVTLTFQVAHNFYFGDFHEVEIYGPLRTARLNPLASALERGFSTTIHHDSPVHPVDPFFLVWTAVNRTTRSGRVIGAEQRIGVLDALRACTIEPAYQWREEATKGSLAPGKLADLMVVDADPLAIDPDAIKDIAVLETLKEGETIFESA